MTFEEYLKQLESPEPLPEQVEESQPAEPVEQEASPEPPEPDQDVEPELQPPESEGEDEQVPEPPEPVEPEEIEVPKIEEEPFPEPPEPEREEPKEPEKPLPRQPTLEELMADWPKQPPVEPLPEIDDDQWAQAMRFMGDGLEVTSQADGVSVLNPVRPTERFPLQIIPEAANGFPAKITGNTDADNPAQNRWLYAWEEVYKSALGYDGWSTVTDGRSGTTSTHPARNSIEDINTAADAHTEGNGVDPANLDTAAYTFTMMPCTTGNVVWMQEITVTITDDATYTEYWFYGYPNGVDGTCD